ncbi:tRNA (adenosine(37)-N6)-threonylcarbamoyltransferase complex ATPase subunit type 1 TsaE [Robiginitalea sp.]|uniref:tRNA (adenosine(37)-N6)-threonylcarbamoyltransferase complex ATPase subunit type 1 TsaE n=1 Tax=Robiginitalea sp. TaxID=1902411 RepID=UPI003C7879E2
MSNIIYNLNEIHKAAAFLREGETSKLYCFYGALGAGKTTLIKALIADLGVVEAGSSPTFGLVHEYCNAAGDLVAYHLDCYRLQGEEEALDLGIEEILGADCHIFIEWPQRIEGLLPPSRTDVSLEIEGAKRRKLSLGRKD